MNPDHLLRSWTKYAKSSAYLSEISDSTVCTTWHELSFNNGYRIISVSFGEVPGRTDAVCVRSVNWRCEHEPHGLMKIEYARKFYRACLAEGMVKP